MQRIFRILRHGFFLCVTLRIVACSWVRAASAGDEFVRTYELKDAPEPVLEHILAQSEFHRKKNALRELWDWFINQLGDALGQIGAPPDWVSDVFAFIGYFLGITAIIVVLCAAGYAVWKFSSRARATAEADTPVSHEQLLVFDTSENELKRTRDLVSRGQFSLALVHLFNCMLSYLNESGRVSLHRVKTNREILASLQPTDGARPILQQFIPVFNMIRYGDGQCDREQYEEFERRCARVIPGMGA